MDVPITLSVSVGCLRSKCQNMIREARDELGEILMRENREKNSETGKAQTTYPFLRGEGREVKGRAIDCCAILRNFGKPDGES